MNWQLFFLNPAVVWVLIPITVIVVGAITTLAKMYFTHQERIAMIEQGIHPDRASRRPTDEPDFASSVPVEAEMEMR